jgi:Carbohydrate esterase, sialic acid-specific acetylesterase
MKKIIFYLSVIAMLVWQNTLYAQTADVITFPVNGTVFQRTNDNHNFSFSGQLQTTGSIRYQIRRRSNIGPVYYWNNVSSGTIVGDNSSTGQTWTVGGTRGFFKNHGNLTTGWYELRLYNNSGNLGTKSYKSTIEFGVGDIYFIAGQSNAAGYSFSDDPTIPYTAVSQNRYSRVLKINEGNYSSLAKGLPYQNKFDIFESGNASVPLKPIYPNGVSSWYWNALAEKIKVPTLFFNNAVPGTKVNFNWNGADGGALRNQFLNTLKQYGSILGAKAVFWHQGEGDSQELTLSSTVAATYLTAYTTNLKNLITDSRNTISGGTNLAWYVSKVSFTTSVSQNSGLGIGTIRSSPLPTFATNCLPLNSSWQKEINNSLIAAQSNVLTGNTNVFEGVSTDALNECQRAPNWRIHFTGSSLETIATAWKARLDATSSNTSSVPATELIPLTAVTQSASNANDYELTSSESTTSTFHWVKNDAGFKSVAGVTGSNSNKFKFLNTSAGDVLTCYILRSNGKIYASQSFNPHCRN